MKTGAATSLLLMVLATGCGSQTHTPSTHAEPARLGKPYRVYTHCGIKWAQIEGTFWRATPPLSDGNGNPPVGWGNPFQAGTLTLESRTTAEFSSPAGSATFRRTPLKKPPLVCS